MNKRKRNHEGSKVDECWPRLVHDSRLCDQDRPHFGPSLGYVQEMNRSPDKEGLFLAECDADVNGIYRA